MSWNQSAFFQRFRRVWQPGEAVASGVVVPVAMIQDGSAASSREACPLRLVEAVVPDTEANHFDGIQFQAGADCEVLVHDIFATQSIRLRFGSTLIPADVTPTVMWSDEGFGDLVVTRAGRATAAEYGGTLWSPATARIPALSTGPRPNAQPLIRCLTGQTITIQNATENQAVTIQVLVQAIRVPSYGGV